MFYVLNFHDHSFASCDTVQEVASTLKQLRTERGTDYDGIEIIDVCDPDIRLSVSDFVDKFDSEISWDE